jgi:4-diphosphocytidyl-2-C-methyl-D-erythritol kinase
MNLRQTESLQTVLAPAKLNLYLEVLGRRDDGFHELETLLVPLRMYDSISMRATPSKPAVCLSLAVGLRSLAAQEQRLLPPSDNDNLVVRALELLRARSGCTAGAEVELIKRIPMAAGLGGGSSDAAAALMLGNRAWRIDWPLEKLAPLAAELGSDIPFFLQSRPAICRGRGERVESIGAIRSTHFVLVQPPAGLSTAEVYREFAAISATRNEQYRSAAALVPNLRQGNLSGLAKQLKNSLQAAAARLSPWVEKTRAAFAGLDFIGHQLSGSGTCYFGICRHTQHARRLATTLRMQQLGLVYVTRSC